LALAAEATGAVAMPLNEPSPEAGMAEQPGPKVWAPASSAEAEELLQDVAARCAIAGLGLTGLHEDADPAVLVRLAAAAGL